MSRRRSKDSDYESEDEPEHNERTRTEDPRKKTDNAKRVDKLVIYNNGSQLCKKINMKGGHKTLNFNNKVDPNSIVVSDGNDFIAYHLETTPDRVFAQKDSIAIKGDLMSRSGKDLTIRTTIDISPEDGNKDANDKTQYMEISNADLISILKEGEHKITFKNNGAKNVTVSYFNPFIYWEAYHTVILGKNTIKTWTVNAEIKNKSGFSINADEAIFRTGGPSLNYLTKDSLRGKFSIKDYKQYKQYKQTVFDDSNEFLLEKMLINSECQIDINIMNKIDIRKKYIVYSDRRNPKTIQKIIKFITKDPIPEGKIIIYNEQHEMLGTSFIEKTDRESIVEINLSEESIVAVDDIVHNSENGKRINLNVSNSSNEDALIEYRLLINDMIYTSIKNSKTGQELDSDSYKYLNIEGPEGKNKTYFIYTLQCESKTDGSMQIQLS